MTRFGQTGVATRPAPLLYSDWCPRPYMQRAVEHLTTRMAAGLALDPGMGKTSITLEAFCVLQEQGRVRTMLVVAPLRVCRMVWRQEAAKWTQFRHLKFSLLHGDKKEQRLRDDADIYLINPEGVEWLSRQFTGRSLSTVFDIVTIDELTKFKNSQADRSKALLPRLRGVQWRWGLTGSLAPNGYMDLFGQMKMLDDGVALGRYITHYRDQYFSLGYDGFTYELMPGAEARIVAKIAPYWMQLSAEDYLDLPELIADPILIDLPKTARTSYDRMKKVMLAELPEGIVTASNAASTYSKLSQMANGAVYIGEKREVALIHHEKLDALETLVESLDGKPLLVAYEFNHDLEAIRGRFGDIPYLGKGTTPTQEALWIAQWNRNELPILAAHPASAGHGLNLQEGACAHVCWYGITWDMELWDQFIRRVRRSGNVALHVMNHMLIVRGTIDELKLEALAGKDLTQQRLLKALNTEIRRDAETLAAQGDAVNYRRKDEMVSRLSRPGAAPAANEAPAPIQPKGWGAPKDQANQTEPAQQERIQSNLRGEAQADTQVARPVFGQRVQPAAQEQGAEPAQEQGAEPAQEHSNGVRTDMPDQAPKTAARRRAPTETEPKATVVSNNGLDARARLIAALIAADPQASVDDLTAVANDLWAWIAA